jgi:molecular chaperone GrpE
MNKKKNLKEEEKTTGSDMENNVNQSINSQDNDKSGVQENIGPDSVTAAAEDQVEKQVPKEEVNSAKQADSGPGFEEKLAEMQDRYLRLSAEFDNYRKRTLREKIELTKHAGEEILKSIVPVLDDFERALKSMENNTDCTSVKSGIDLIYNKFRESLKQNGLREIESMNVEFNVDLHEAVSKMPVEDEAMKGKVVDVLQKGYYLHDKVMRFSKVVVGE